MKISQSLLIAYVTAQGEDRWGSTDYYSFNYGFGGKQDAGVAPYMTEGTTHHSWGTTNSLTAGSMEILGEYNNLESDTHDNLHYNGLLCWMCDFRLDLATEPEQDTCNTDTAEGACQNAYARCLKHGMLMRCRGEQRTCMFEERRRHGVVYSVCTGCKQTDACVAHWRRNQRFTLPFMNFGDMSLRNLPKTLNNLDSDGGDTDNDKQNQLPNHRPVYIDDECTTYQETQTHTEWRKKADYPAYNPTTGALGTMATKGTISDVYPMNWRPAGVAGSGTGAGGAAGEPFSRNKLDTRQYTGFRNNIGLSYSKFAYDGTGAVQLNAQLSQWESTCRWCCHARPDTVCNIEMTNINSSPFSTKCGNSRGTRRDAVIKMYDADAGSESSAAADSYAEHDIATALKLLKTYITDETEALDNSNTVLKYWGLLSTLTGTINGSDMLKAAATGCSLSNAVWDAGSYSADNQRIKNAEEGRFPRDIHGKFRFFQPFNIAQVDADYYYCDAVDGTTNACTSEQYLVGPRQWMQIFQRTPQYDLSTWYGTDLEFTAKFPATGEGRNSAGMDKYAGRGNKSRQNTANWAAMKNNKELQHFFQQQTDMVSQENRDFFDRRVMDAASAWTGAGDSGSSGTEFTAVPTYLRRYDNTDFWTNK